MIDYNTSLPKISMREYGRHIQKLIEHCVGIEDREERTQFAYAIADTMVKMFPDLNGDLNKRKVWDRTLSVCGFQVTYRRHIRQHQGRG